MTGPHLRRSEKGLRAAALHAGVGVGLKGLLPTSDEGGLLGLLIPGYTLHCIDERTPAVPHSGETSGCWVGAGAALGAWQWQALDSWGRRGHMALQVGPHRSRRSCCAWEAAQAERSIVAMRLPPSSLPPCIAEQSLGAPPCGVAAASSQPGASGRDPPAGNYKTCCPQCMVHSRGAARWCCSGVSAPTTLCRRACPSALPSPSLRPRVRPASGLGQQRPAGCWQGPLWRTRRRRGAGRQWGLHPGSVHACRGSHASSTPLWRACSRVGLPVWGVEAGPEAMLLRWNGHMHQGPAPIRASCHTLAPPLQSAPARRSSCARRSRLARRRSAAPGTAPSPPCPP